MGEMFETFPDLLFRIATLGMIPLSWFGVCLILSWASGWWQLSRKYAWRDFLKRSESRQRHPPDTAWMHTATFGPIRYHSSLIFSAYDEGIKISIFFLFRLAHPPLFIPWSEFKHVRCDNKLFSQKIRMTIGKPEITRVIMPGWVRYRMPIELRPDV